MAVDHFHRLSDLQVPDQDLSQSGRIVELGGAVRRLQCLNQYCDHVLSLELDCFWLLLATQQTVISADIHCEIRKACTEV